MRPIYGQGFFHLCIEGIIWYMIVFDYDDPEKEYYRLLRKGGKDLEIELNTLKKNMQKFLDEEEMFINGSKVRALVRNVWIEVRGEPSRPSVVFSIVIPFRMPKETGRILYEDYYEEEVAEYDYTVHWIFPSCIKVLDYNISGRISLASGHLMVEVKRGTRISGYESILFDISTCGGK